MTECKSPCPHPWQRLLLLCCIVCCSFYSVAQVTISGTVTSAGGKPVSAMSVMVRSSASGTATDDNGHYTLRVSLKPGDYVLVFSGVGYKPFEKSITIGSSSSYTVDAQVEEEVAKLDEVIVTGTSEGTTRRQLGSYVSTVKADELTKGATGNILAALQGKTAGAQISQNSGDPAGGISVKLRGVSTISGSTEPLYIIDGVIIDNSTNRVTNADPSYGVNGTNGNTFTGNVGQNRMVDINPADIDHIEVLNGAAAAAIYGSRANAGVVQIFTKRGSTGAPVVSFNTSIMNNHLRKKLDVNQAPVKFGGPPDVSTQGLITLVGTPPALATNTSPVSRYDYQDYIFHSALGTDNSVSVSGGKDKTKYYASASYFYNQGIVRNTDFSRYSFRINLDQVLNNWASFSVSSNYIYDKTNEKPDGNSFFSPTNAVTILGNYYDIWKRDSLGNLKAVGERGRVNPVSVIEDIRQQQRTSRIITGAALKLKPFKNFTLDYNLGIDNYSQSGTTLIPPYTYNVNTAFYGGGPTLDPTQNGYASVGNATSFQINHDLNATYTWNISRGLTSVTQVGYSLQYQRTTYALQQGKGLPPFVQTAAAATTALVGADQRTEVSISGEYIQQNFKYRNHLFLTGAIRVDGSSIFNKNQRNLVYPKISGSYVISGTDFWKNTGVSGWWDLFKLRAAYGESGNLTGIPAYGRYNTYIATAFVGSASFQSSTTLVNPDVKPERQKELEIGTDLAFLKNRIGVQFNYYHKRVNDLLINRLIAPTNGYTSVLNNIGALQNQGIEILLNLVPVSGKNFTWSLTGIYNRNRNKALRIGQSLILYNTNGGAPVAILAGQPIGVFYGSFFATDAGGNQLKNSAGIPLTESGIQNGPLTYTPQRDAAGLPTGTALQKIIGDPNPDYTATLTNDFTYKKFGLHIQLDAVQGVSVFNADFRTRQGVDNGKVAEAEDLGKLPRGYIAGVYNIQQWRIDDGSFVKLREVSLSYNIGKLKCFSDLSVSLSGRNLVSWDNYRGYDPEVNAGGQSTVLRGIDFGTIPIPRTFSLGIHAKF